MDGDGGEVLLDQQLGEGGASLHGLDEDHDLVELEDVEQLEQFPVLLGVFELDIVLLQTVQSQLGLVINVNLRGNWN